MPEVSTTTAHQTWSGKLGIYFALAVWVAAIVAATFWALWYDAIPGRTGETRQVWPSAAKWPFSSERPTLLMFVHPRCPCTRASVDELEKLVTRYPDKMDVKVVFSTSGAAGKPWEQPDLWSRVERIPGVTAVADPGGIERDRFGAHVSGEVFLYLPSTQLAFHGGITPGRGHSGDNTGCRAIESILQGDPEAVAKSLVFGCQLDSNRGIRPQVPGPEL